MSSIPPAAEPGEVQTARCIHETGELVIEESRSRLLCDWQDLVLELVALDARERRFRSVLGEPNVPADPRLVYNERFTTVVEVVGAEWLTDLYARETAELFTNRR